MIFIVSICYTIAVLIFIRVSFFGEHPSPLVGATFAFIFFAWGTVFVWIAGKKAGMGMLRSPQNGHIYQVLGQFHIDEKSCLGLQKLRIRDTYIVDAPGTHNVQELTYNLEITGPALLYDNISIQNLARGTFVQYIEGRWLPFPDTGKASIVKNSPKKKKTAPNSISTPSQAPA